MVVSFALAYCPLAYCSHIENNQGVSSHQIPMSKFRFAKSSLSSCQCILRSFIWVSLMTLVVCNSTWIKYCLRSTHCMQTGTTCTGFDVYVTKYLVRYVVLNTLSIYKICSLTHAWLPMDCTIECIGGASRDCWIAQIWQTVCKIFALTNPLNCSCEAFFARIVFPIFIMNIWKCCTSRITAHANLAQCFFLSSELDYSKSRIV